MHEGGEAMKRLFESTIAIGIGSIVGLIFLLMVSWYVIAVAGDIISQSIRGIASVTGIGLILIIGVSALAGMSVIIFQAMGQWQKFLMVRIDRRRKDFESSYTFEKLSEGEQGFLLSERDNDQLVGRPLSYENSPFMTHTLPSQNPVDLAKWQYLNAPTSPGRQNTVNDDIPLLENNPAELPLLPALIDCPNILIVGGKNSGKTTLLQHIEQERLQSGQTIILDSHSQPGQWRGQMIGCGRGYSKIKNAMIGLNNLLDNRYKIFSTGNNDFEPIHQFVDEYTLLPGYLKKLDFDIANWAVPQLTEGRKIGMNLVVGIHSARAKNLGLSGQMDILESFDVIVFLKNIQGQRYAICDFGEGKTDTKYIHPGPFVHQQQITQTVDYPLPSEFEFVVSEPEPDMPNEDELKAIEAYISVRDSGQFSWRKATKLAFGPDKFGSTYNEKLKSILNKWDVSYSE